MPRAKAGPVNAERLESFIRRIEKLEEERASIGIDIREVYGEAKGVGYDVKTMRKVVALRKMDAADRAEQETLLDVYMHALGDGMSASASQAEMYEERRAREIDRCLRLTNNRQPPTIAAIMAELDCSAGKASLLRKLCEERISNSPSRESDEIETAGSRPAGEESCGDGESRPVETTLSLECVGGTAREEMPASDGSATASAGQPMDVQRCESAPEKSGLGSDTGRNGGTAGVAPGPQDTLGIGKDDVGQTDVGNEVDAPVDSGAKRGGDHVDDLAISPIDGLKADESPAAGEKAASPTGGDHDPGLTVEPEVARVAPPATPPASHFDQPPASAEVHQASNEPASMQVPATFSDKIKDLTLGLKVPERQPQVVIDPDDPLTIPPELVRQVSA